MPQFEVAIYNKEVRELVAMGQHHRNLSDDWADIHYIEVRAANEAEARSKIFAKYPEIDGYLIDTVISMIG